MVGMARAYKRLARRRKSPQLAARFIQALLCGRHEASESSPPRCSRPFAAPAPRPGRQRRRRQPPPRKHDLVPVAIDTSLGRIVVALDRSHAPITTANFLHYVDTHRFDGENFYRAMHMGDGGLIQGGVTQRRAQALPADRARADQQDRPAQCRRRDLDGQCRRRAPRSADFFILLADMPAFDAGGPSGDAIGFAAFGHVVEGMDVVKKIFDAPVSATKGEGAMKGQMLDPPVKIIKADAGEVVNAIVGSWTASATCACGSAPAIDRKLSRSVDQRLAPIDRPGRRLCIGSHVVGSSAARSAQRIAGSSHRRRSAGA